MAQYRKRSYATANQYANVSEAYDFNALPYDREEYQYPMQRESVRRIRIRKRVKKRPVYVRWDDKKRKISMLSIITVLIIFAGGLGTAYSYATVSSARSRLYSLQNELKEKQEHNISLKGEVAESYNLSEIERIATTKLGMSKPKPYQIVYINVSKQSYAVRNTPEEETKQSGTFAGVIEYVKNKILG